MDQPDKENRFPTKLTFAAYYMCPKPEENPHTAIRGCQCGRQRNAYIARSPLAFRSNCNRLSTRNSAQSSVQHARTHTLAACLRKKRVCIACEAAGMSTCRRTQTRINCLVFVLCCCCCCAARSSSVNKNIIECV